MTQGVCIDRLCRDLYVASINNFSQNSEIWESMTNVKYFMTDPLKNSLKNS